MRERLTIRVKLAAALLAPLVVLAGFAFVQVRAASDDAAEARRQADLASAGLGPGGLVAALQNERNFETLRVIGLERSVETEIESSQEARDATNAAGDQFSTLVVRLDESVTDVYEPALAELDDGLNTARDLVDQVPAPYGLANAPRVNELFEAYSAVIETFQSANAQIAASIDDEELRSGIELLYSISREQEIEAVLSFHASIGALLDRPLAVREVLQLSGARGVGDDAIRALGVGPYAELVNSRLDTAARRSYRETIEQFLADPDAVDIDAVLSANDGGHLLSSLHRDVAFVVGGVADRVVYDAEEQQRNYLYIAGLAVLAVALITFVVGRSISRPLRKLTAEANIMAAERLPRAVNEILETPLGEDIQVPALPRVSTRAGGEVARVADALNKVQESALELAVEQTVLRRNFADSFVNLGRRNQNLLGRQLDLVTELEQNETDPDALENLFKIDHLATRMRRNAESLLVLAGLEPPRQWSAPIPAGDVVRGALGEVEDYRRVEIHELEDATVLGAAAADVTHILAELLENGLQFSPPSEPVDVYGRRTDDGYVITVVDRGFGMSETDLGRANQRLAAAESFTVAPSRYLGHYVAAHLARRHTIAVNLSASPAGGVSAAVTLPTSIVDPQHAALPVTAPSQVSAVVSEPEPSEVADAEPMTAVTPSLDSFDSLESGEPVESAFFDALPLRPFDWEDPEASEPAEADAASDLDEPSSPLPDGIAAAAAFAAGAAMAVAPHDDEPADLPDVAPTVEPETTASGLPKRSRRSEVEVAGAFLAPAAAEPDPLEATDEHESLVDAEVDTPDSAVEPVEQQDETPAADTAVALPEIQLETPVLEVPEIEGSELEVPELEAEAPAEAETEVETDVEAEVEVEVDAETEVETDVEAETEVEIEAETHVEAEVETESATFVEADLVPEPVDESPELDESVVEDMSTDPSAGGLVPSFVDDAATLLPKRRGRRFGRDSSGRAGRSPEPQPQPQPAASAQQASDATSNESTDARRALDEHLQTLSSTYASLTGTGLDTPGGTDGATTKPDLTAFAGPSGGGRTAGGLARRVRGAQMPSDTPVLARPTENADDAPATTAPSQRPSGEEVYNTLADFRAGMERGKQRTAQHQGSRNEEPPDDDGNEGVG